MLPFDPYVYQGLRALHLIAMVAWFAGLFYLPRLFVYHADSMQGGEASEIFKVMERRLLKVITNPAMIAVWIFGLAMLAMNTSILAQGWMHAKLTLILLLSGYHGFLAGRVKKFARDANDKPARFYRIINEIPTLFLVLIVVLAVFRPF